MGLVTGAGRGGPGAVNPHGQMWRKASTPTAGTHRTISWIRTCRTSPNTSTFVSSNTSTNCSMIRVSIARNYKRYALASLKD